MKLKIKFVVIGEHTLAYVRPSQPETAWILNSSIVRGATATWQDGDIPLKDWRPARRADFETFRVVSTGYEKDTEIYEFPTE